MVDIAPSRQLIQYEETQFRGAVSENIMQKVGGLNNFLAEREYSEKQWFINGAYNVISTPFLGIDGFTMVEFDATLVDAFMFVQGNGTSGLTELDVKYWNGSSFVSVFSTTPKIQTLAGDDKWTYVGAGFPNTTAPVFAVTALDAKTVLRCDVINVPGGLTTGCGIVLMYQPR